MASVGASTAQIATLDANLEAFEDGGATLDADTTELLRSQTRRLARLSDDIVFERFYRVDASRDRTHGGSGIGLAIAKALVEALVEAHGGQLTVTSPGTGQGATFQILLPRR